MFVEGTLFPGGLPKAGADLDITSTGHQLVFKGTLHLSNAHKKKEKENSRPRGLPRKENGILR